MPFENLSSSVGLLVLSIVVVTKGAGIASSRELSTRIGSLRGTPAFALGMSMVVAGLAGAGIAWFFGLRLGE